MQLHTLSWKYSSSMNILPLQHYNHVLDKKVNGAPSLKIQKKKKKIEKNKNIEAWEHKTDSAFFCYDNLKPKHKENF